MVKAASTKIEHINLDKLARSRKIYRPEQLQRILEHYGLESQGRKSGGSHENFKHPIHGIACTLIHHHNGHNPKDINRRIADACKAVIAAEKQATPSELSGQFEDAQQALPLTVDVMPDHIIAEATNGHIILRHAEYLCIGAVAKTQMHPNRLTPIIHQIEAKATEFGYKLDEAQQQYGLRTRFKDSGHLAVTAPKTTEHPYGYSFAPFTPDNAAPPLEALSELLFKAALHHEEPEEELPLESAAPQKAVKQDKPRPVIFNKPLSRLRNRKSTWQRHRTANNPDGQRV